MKKLANTVDTIASLMRDCCWPDGFEGLIAARFDALCCCLARIFDALALFCWNSWNFRCTRAVLLEFLEFSMHSLCSAGIFDALSLFGGKFRCTHAVWRELSMHLRCLAGAFGAPDHFKQDISMQQRSSSPRVRCNGRGRVH